MILQVKLDRKIYQNDEILIHEPTAEDIVPIIDKIIHVDKMLEKIERGV